VDDISTNLRVAKELMAPYNMNIQTCLSGREAIVLLKDNRYEIIFMAHMMPGMDGIETTALIRSIDPKDEYFKKLPIIALTANAVSGQREIFLEKGINDFLAKPIEIQKLDEILKKWLPEEKRSTPDQTYREGAKGEKIEVINISGVDSVLGLRNCGGDVQIYFDILIDFCKDAETRIEKITDAISKNDSQLYTTLVHALKGAARSIGAIETGERASWLEKTSASGGLDGIKDKNAELMEDLKILIGNIKAAKEQRETKDNRKHVGVSSLRLEILKTALKEMDVEAVNRMLITFAGLSLDNQTRALIAEVEEQILMFEYEKAIEKINKLLSPK
jgi:CheY-like chemotaxis protein